MHKYLFIGDMKIQLYNILNVFSFIPLLIFNLCQYKKKKENLSICTECIQQFFLNKLRLQSRFRFLKLPSFWIFVEIFIFSAIQLLPARQLTVFFGRVFATSANYFSILFLMPIILFFFCFLLGVHPTKQIDLLTPSFALSLIFIKLACFCQGCCYGIEWKHGMYNHNTGAVEFPVQLLEIGWAVLLFIFLYFYRNKAKPGTLFPLYIILYSATRFCSEFLRREENVFGPLKIYHLFCIAGIIIGIIEYFLVCKYGEKMSALATTGMPTLIKNISQAIAQRKKKKRKAANKKMHAKKKSKKKQCRH